MSDVPRLPHVFLAFLSYTGGFSSNDTSIVNAEWHDNLCILSVFPLCRWTLCPLYSIVSFILGDALTTFWIGSFFLPVTERYLLLLMVIFGFFAFLRPVSVSGWSVYSRLISLFTSTACKAKATVFSCPGWNFAYVRLSLPFSEYTSMGCDIKILCVLSLVK